MTDRPERVGAVAAIAGVAVVCGALVVVSTRVAPQLSPDSVTYLSAADHLRRGLGVVDFTGEPLAVFPPVYPLLLAPGGTSLDWVRALGAAAVAAAVVLMYVVLRRRTVRPSVALVGAAAFGASQGLIRVASTAWSEAPYIVVALATLLVLGRQEVSPRRAAVGGALAGLGFLTRYAGIGLVVTGAVVLLVPCLLRPRADGRPAAPPAVSVAAPVSPSAAWRALGAYVVVATCVGGAWIVRNFVRTGTALGPRFEGGTGDAPTVLLRRPLLAFGELVVGQRPSSAVTQVVGLAVLIGLAALALAGGAAAVRHGSTPHPLDLGMAVFAVTSLVVPVVARAVTANDIEYRVMSPMLVPLTYGIAVAVERWWRLPWVRVVGLAAAVASIAHGVVIVEEFPDGAHLSTGARELFSPALYDAVDTLPKAATVVTNFPQGMWWQARREPTLFAFTRPRAGNSHMPLTADETVALVCRGPTYLAWFGALLNAGGGPAERRPDIVTDVGLVLEQDVPGGQLYRLEVRDPAMCADGSG